MTSAGRGPRLSDKDRYPTPPWPVHRFLEEWPFLKHAGPRWLEPCAGEGSIIRAVNQYRREQGLPSVEWTAADIYDTRQQLEDSGVAPDHIHVGDFLWHRGDDDSEVEPQGPLLDFAGSDFDVVITNPPFRYAMEFIDHCLEIAKCVIMLERANFPGSRERNDFFRSHVPDQHFVPDRIDFSGDGNADSVECSWFVWGPGDKAKKQGRYFILKHTPLEERKAARPRVGMNRPLPDPDRPVKTRKRRRRRKVK